MCVDRISIRLRDNLCVKKLFMLTEKKNRKIVELTLSVKFYVYLFLHLMRTSVKLARKRQGLRNAVNHLYS